jgi:hypothetical protein
LSLAVRLRAHGILGLVRGTLAPLSILALLLLASCLGSPDDKAVIAALQADLSVSRSVPERIQFPAPPDKLLRPPLQSPRCFPDHPPDDALVETYARRNRLPHPSPGRTAEHVWNAAVERAADVELEEEPVFRVSRVAFDADRSTALVYAEVYAPLAGFAGFFVLHRHQDGWQLADTCELWAS